MTTPDYSDRTLEDESREISVRLDGVHENDRVTTLPELLAAFDVDPDEFEVTYFKPNSWETHFGIKDETGATTSIFRAVNYQAKATLKKNHTRWTTEKVAEVFIGLVKDHSPKYKAVKRDYSSDEEITAVVDLFDLHIGMLAWGEETGDDDWDSRIDVAAAEVALDGLLYRLRGMNITKFIFPMGNDLLHTDTTIAGKGGMTSGGTPQDVDTRYLKMFRAAAYLMVIMIDKLRQIAPVEVVVVPGNHDRERAAYIGEYIHAWYRHDPEVEVNNNASLRKYVKVGTTLLGFTHGDQEKAENLPMIMASEQKVLWAETDFRVFHTGHFHKKRKMLSVTTDTYNGTEVITLPSLVPPDAWHAMRGFVGGGRAAEVHLVSETAGPCGYFRYNLVSNG